MLGRPPTLPAAAPPLAVEVPDPPPVSPPETPPGLLLDGSSAGDYLEQAVATAELVADKLAEVERPFSGRSPAELRPDIDAVDLETPLPQLSDLWDEVRRLYLDDAVWFHHPSYVAHLNCPVALPAAVADQVATAVNSSLDTWDQSAGATLIERRLVAWTAERLGLPHTADGVFTSGGTASNLEALLLARGHSLETVAATVPSGLERMRILASADSHFSVTKSARMLGLGEDAVVHVRTDAAHRLLVPDLVSKLARLESTGLVPMAVVATAGTTDFGAVDPLAAISEVCRAYGVWLHVDAAYGGGLVTSRRHRHLLDGIEHADSVTVDFHKTFFQPVASSAVLVRDARALRHACLHADYLNPADADPDDRPNQVDKSLQTTRRFDALKLWATLRSLGPDRIGLLLDDVLDLADEVWSLLDAHPDFEVCQRPTLSTLVFRYARPGLDDVTLDGVNANARARLFASGEGVVAGTKVSGRTFLKLTLLNPATTLDDVANVIEMVRTHAHEAVELERWAG